MRKAIVIILFLLIVSPLYADKYALLVGVSQYPQESGWGNISADNDIDFLKKVLSPTWNVITLENEQATRDGIIGSFDSLSSIVSDGDTLLIHFSCHGQQMLPLINECDFLDEALIPYDAEKKWSDNYKGENHLRDDELSKHIDTLRNVVGENGLVIVALDACHSDSMDKAKENDNDDGVIYRGTGDIFGENIPDTILVKRYARDTSKIGIDKNSHVIYLSACEAYSKNAEIVHNGKGYGSLSYATAKALANGEITDVKVFLDNIVISMDSLVPYQTPGVRTSFAYCKPELNMEIADDTYSDNSQSKNKTLHIGFIILSIILFITIVWRITKK